MSELPLISYARKEFHKELLKSLLTVCPSGVASNADKDNRTSVAIARSIAEQLQVETGVRSSAQSSGNQFEAIVSKFVLATFPNLPHLRPGRWEVRQVKSRGRSEISKFSQYAHLVALQQAAASNTALAAALGNDYTITPDVIVTRDLEDDVSINQGGSIVDGSVSALSDLRAGDGKSPLLHASISTKWTLRSDRAQNARSEALNLIRNRKGRQPHIMVVTGEPTPSRLSSLALGTGDIDCVYHFALDELLLAVKALNNSECEDMLKIMVDGKRLKDISDLPLDLAV